MVDVDVSAGVPEWEVNGWLGACSTKLWCQVAAAGTGCKYTVDTLWSVNSLELASTSVSIYCAGRWIVVVQVFKACLIE